MTWHQTAGRRADAADADTAGPMHSVGVDSVDSVDGHTGLVARGVYTLCVMQAVGL